MSGWLIPLVVVVYGWLVAFVALRRTSRAPASTVWVACLLSPAVGFGLLSLIFFAWIYAMASIPRAATLGVLLAVVGFCYAVPRSKVRNQAQAAKRPRISKKGLAEAVVLGMAVISAVLFGKTFVAVTAAQPFGGWDAIAIWNVRSLFLFRGAENLPELYSNLQHGHPDYPLMIPAAIAGQFTLLGHEGLAVVQGTGLVITLAAGLALCAALTEFSSLFIGLVGLAVLWSTPAYWRWGSVQYADIPLAYLTVAAAYCLATQLEPTRIRPLPPQLVGLVLGLLAWVKNEGLVIALILAAAFALVTALSPRVGSLRWKLVALTIGALPPIAALVVFKTQWSPANETAHFLAGGREKLFDIERWKTVLGAFLEHINPLSGHETWGLTWLFLVAAALFLSRLRSRLPAIKTFLVVSFSLCFVAWCSVYVLTPSPLEWHLNSSSERLLLQLVPLAILSALAGVEDRNPSAS